MKRTIKDYLKLGILLFGVSVAITSCQKDDEILTQNNNQTTDKIKVQHKSFSDLLTDKKIAAFVRDYPSKREIKNKISNRTLQSQENDFYIDTSKSIYIENSDSFHKSYTFSVIRPNPDENYIENLVLSFPKEGVYQLTLVKYELTLQEIQDVKDGVSIDLSDNLITLTPIQDTIFDNILGERLEFIQDGDCYSLVDTGCSYGNHTDGMDEDGGDCPGHYENEIWSFCNESGGGGSGISGGDGSPTGDPSGGEGTSGGGGSSSGGGDVIDDSCKGCGWTAPIPDIPELELEEEEECIPLTAENQTAITNYLTANSNSAAANHFVEDFKDVNCKFPDAKFDRYVELMDILESNPWALIEDCAQQNGLDIADYQQLYNHTLPTSCIDKLNTLGNEFQDQPLQNGNATVANVDYYNVVVTTNPDFNDDGIPDSDAVVYQKYKENFTNLATGSKDDFHFSCNAPWITGIGNTANVGWSFLPYSHGDTILWNSSSPLTSIIKIDAWAEGLPFSEIADDGAIMISEFTTDHWIGSTIQTAFSGTQPFSGNRQWGYITNSSGNLELYAKAVDVARVSALVNFLPTSDDSPENCQEDTYYNIGEATWSNLQEQIKQWVVDNHGQAQVIEKIAVRFDKDKIKQILESNDTIDQILCN